jgi:hypothetical protein
LAELPARLRDPLTLAEEAARTWQRLSEPETVVYRRRASITMRRTNSCSPPRPPTETSGSAPSN